MISSVVLRTKENYYFYDQISKYIVPVNKVFYDIFHEAANGEFDKVYQKFGSIYSKNDLDKAINKIKNYINLGLMHKSCSLQINPVMICSVEKIKLLYRKCSQLVLQVTERCQLDCIYCCYGTMYNEHPLQKEKDMECQIALNAIEDRIKSWSCLSGSDRGIEFFISFYGGEPLLNFDLIEKVVHYTKQHMPNDINYRFTMTTNGLLLKKYIDYLVENNFNLLVSLDGNREANSCRVYTNGQPSFDQLIENLDHIQSNFPQYFKNNIFFNSVYTAKADLSESSSFIQNRYGKPSSISGINPDHVSDVARFQKLNSNLQRGILDSISSIKDKNIYNHFSLLQKTYVKKFCKIYTNFCSSDYCARSLTCETPVINNGTCLPFFKKIFIDVDGHILPCERVLAPFPLGEIDKNGVSIDFDSVTEKYNALMKKNTELCATCLDAYTCNHCHYSSFTQGCKYYQNSEKYINNLEYKLMLAESFPVSSSVTIKESNNV